MNGSRPESADIKVTVGSEQAGFDSFVVGIGASAGGLEALERFFTHCPTDTGASFVVVQHLSPDHKSMMIDLLARYTSMPIVIVSDGMPIEPDKVFLIPAGKIMRLSDSRFELKPKTPHTLTLPIDIFFTSLAESCARYAVGVVLSGTGSDGSRGAVAINASGGFLMAQESKTAKFDGMPASVIGTGLVDAILPAEELPKRLLSHINNLPPETLLQSAPQDTEVPVTDEEAFEGILQMLLQSAGIDFHDYKLATLLRRIERRMQVRHLGNIEDYYTLLKGDRGELVTLKRELLIPVTNFFRDTEAFGVLEKEVINSIVANAGTGSSIRVWVAGTSTGEEAFSIGMLFLEAFEQERRWPNLKIFATDVSHESIETASSGTYSDATATEITSERLERFFNASGNTYVVKPELRQTIVFAKHNLLSDPPFTQMDLVTCRNTLIYFNQDAQRRVLQRLQFATKSKGYLFLGSSEALANGEMGFTGVDTKHKIFQRSANVPLMSFDVQKQALRGYTLRGTRSKTNQAAAVAGDTAALDSATKSLLQQYAPPSMLVNNHNAIVHLFGDVKPYFQAREGSASLELSRVLPESVAPVASALMFKVVKDQQRLVSDLIRVELGDGRRRLIRLSVKPLSQQPDETLMLLSFEEQTGKADGREPERVDVDAETMARMEVLERELAATRESLQSTIEELETSNEELQATNEELMASNEELQSSNEELQSVNEELNTVNAEYQEKVGILNKVNVDLDTMAKAVGVPTVFVDHEMNLTRYSPDAVGIFKIREPDLGRPLEEITNTLKYSTLLEDLQTTLRTERMVQKEIPPPEGCAVSQQTG